MTTFSNKFSISEIDGKRVVVRQQPAQDQPPQSYQQQQTPPQNYPQPLQQQQAPPQNYQQQPPQQFQHYQQQTAIYTPQQTSNYPPQQISNYPPQQIIYEGQPQVVNAVSEPFYNNEPQQEQYTFYESEARQPIQYNGSIPLQRDRVFVTRQAPVETQGLVYPRNGGNNRVSQMRQAPAETQVVTYPRNGEGKRYEQAYRHTGGESGEANTAKRSYKQINQAKKPFLGVQHDDATTSVFTSADGLQFGTAFAATDQDSFFVDSARNATQFLQGQLHVNSQFIGSATTHIKKKIDETVQELAKSELDAPNIAGVSIVDDIFYVFSTGGALTIIFNRDGSYEQLFSETEPHRDVSVLMRSTKVASFGVILSAAAVQSIGRDLLMTLLAEKNRTDVMAQNIWKNCASILGASVLCFRF